MRAWLFVCLFGVLGSTREFFTHMETSPLPRDANLTYTRHSWPLSSEGSLVPTVTQDIRLYGRHRGSMTLTLVAERLVVDLSLPVLTTYVCRGWDSNTQISACEANTLTDCATAAASTFEYKFVWTVNPFMKQISKIRFNHYQANVPCSTLVHSEPHLWIDWFFSSSSCSK